MRSALRLVPLLALALCAALLAGCGGGDSDSGSTSGGPSHGPAGASVEECAGGVGATGVSCGAAEGVAAGWKASPGCKVVDGASHATCRIEGYLCIAAAVERGTAVSCALPQRSIFFEVRG